MYNPYNWNIRTITSKDVSHDKLKTPKPQVVYNCILDELGNIGNDLDAARIDRIEIESKMNSLKKELEECNKEIIRLEQRKVYLINKLAETP